MSSTSSITASEPVIAGTSRVLQIGLAKQTGRNSCYAATASAAYNFVSPDHKITERAVCKYVADVKRSSPKNASPRTTEIEDPILFLQGHHAFSSSIAPTDTVHGKGPSLCGVIKYEIDNNAPLLMLLNEHYVTVVGYRVNVNCESNNAISPNVFDILISDPDPHTESEYWYNLGSLTKYENRAEPRITASVRKQMSSVKPAVLSSTGQVYRGIVLLKNPQTASSKPLSPSIARDKFYSPSPSPKKTKTGRVSAATSKGRGGSIGNGHSRRSIRRNKNGNTARNRNQRTKRELQWQ